MKPTFAHLRLVSVTLAASLVVATAFAAFGADGPADPKGNPNAATQPSDLLPYNGSATPFVSEWTRPINEAAARMKVVGIALRIYQDKHSRQMPADFGAIISEFIGGNPDGCFQTPGDQRQTKVPKNITADWVNSHTSYVYLAGNVNLDKLDASINPAGTVVIAFHTKLDQPFNDGKLGQVIIATCLDRHSEVIPIEKASEEIAMSKRFLDAARSPSP